MFIYFYDITSIELYLHRYVIYVINLHTLVCIRHNIKNIIGYYNICVVNTHWFITNHTQYMGIYD